MVLSGYSIIVAGKSVTAMWQGRSMQEWTAEWMDGQKDW